MQGVGGVGLRGRSALLPLTAIAVVAIDQAVKALVRARLPLGEPIPVIPHVLWFTHVENTGGAFSLLAEFSWSRWLFMAAPAVVLVIAVAIWTFGHVGRWQAAALGLVTGGAAGNLFDRLAFGRVTDFLDIRVWPVFNVADSAVVVGVCALGAWIMLAHRDKQLETADGQPPGGHRAPERH